MNAATLLDLLFLASVGLIWFMIGYQFLLTIAGFVYAFQARRESVRDRCTAEELPSITILVPAHNEEVVIEHTVRALLDLHYPQSKLELLVIDDNSGDSTLAILRRLQHGEPRLKVLHRGPDEGGRGKSAALNAALKLASGDLIAVYDADNQPEPEALWLLASQMARHPRLGAAIGKFRAFNKGANLLTRFINLEGLGFQWIVQAGRWKLLKVATIPGTNFVIRRSLMEELGGWDDRALTEDSELSIRVYEHGCLIKFVPDAVTWEQEPETLRVWRRQRVRWVRGNNYVIGKFARSLFRFRSKRLAIEMLYVLSLYYLFLGAVVVSDLFFVLGGLGLVHANVYGPFAQVWALAVILFVLELLVALSLDREDNPVNALLIPVMYVSYCQAWLWVVFEALYHDFIRRSSTHWVKTPRFALRAEASKAVVRAPEPADANRPEPLEAEAEAEVAQK